MIESHLESEQDPWTQYDWECAESEMIIERSSEYEFRQWQKEFYQGQVDLDASAIINAINQMHAYLHPSDDEIREVLERKGE